MPRRRPNSPWWPRRDAGRATALETAAILDMNLGLPERAADRGEAALSLYRRLGDARGVARILDGRAMGTFLDGHIGEAVEVFGRVAQLFTDSGDLLRVVTPRSTRGHGLVFPRRPADGLVESSEALRLARDLDAPEGQTYALWHRSEALSALGDGEEGARPRRARRCRSPGRRSPGLDGHGLPGTRYRAPAGGLARRPAAAFAASATTAGREFTLFASWAAARGALVAIAPARLNDAELWS